MRDKRKIYFICPYNRAASGGVKQIYRMAELLKDSGYDCELVQKNNKRPTWFESRIGIRKNAYLFKKLKFNIKGKLTFWNQLILFYLKKTSPSFEDDAILVFPEVYGDSFFEIYKNEYVIFNQNCYYTFDNIGDDDTKNPYLSERLKGVIVVSEDSKTYLQRAFPNLNIERIMLGVNPQSFRYSAEKQKTIAFMPRKLAEDVKQVTKLFSIGGIDGWTLLPIDGKSESEVGEIMQKSSIFLSFNHREGFGLPPVEAMSCGCYVVGYTGRGGEEYFKPEFSTAVENGDIVSFVRELKRLTADPDIFRKAKLSADFASRTYSLANEKASTLKAWQNILGS